MKKVYLLLTVALLSSALANAQLARSTKNEAKKKSTNNSAVARHSGPTQVNTVNSVIWSDDFSTAANWTISHPSGLNSSTGPNDWVIGAAGPSGSFAINPINTTGDFAMFDSDVLCGGDQIADLTTASPINLTGHAQVKLTFNEFYERFHDSTYVFVSTNGTSWTKFEVNAGLSSNFFPGGTQPNTPGSNPYPVSLDISSVAGNQATVWIRFEFYSPDTNGAGPDTATVNGIPGTYVAGCAYAWMIDDVAIADIATIDASVVQNDASEYTALPIIQPEAFSLRGRLTNSGLTPFTGGQIIFNVYSMTTGLVFSDTSAAAPNLNPGDTSAFLTGSQIYTPTAMDFYTVEQLVYMTGDGDASNDTSLNDIFVNDSIYARDGWSVGSGGIVGAYGFNGATGSFANIFEIWHASDLTSASAFLSGPTVGDQISYEVYSVTGGVPDALLATTGAHTLLGSDTGIVTLPFTAPLSVTAGQYAIAVNQLGTNLITLVIATDAITPNKSFYKTSGAWTPLVPSLNGVPVIWVNNPSGTLLSAKSLVDTKHINLYPNPSTGYIYITGNNDKNVTVEVTNSTGQLVKSAKFESLTVNHLDLRSAPAGMYNVRIISDAGTVVKTVVIE
jgi:hypothetical protein